MYLVLSSKYYFILLCISIIFHFLEKFYSFCSAIFSMVKFFYLLIKVKCVNGLRYCRPLFLHKPTRASHSRTKMCYSSLFIPGNNLASFPGQIIIKELAHFMSQFHCYSCCWLWLIFICVSVRLLPFVIVAVIAWLLLTLFCLLR